MTAAAPSSTDASADPIVVSVSHVGKAFGPITVLSDVSLEFRGGEIHALMGENGAGKSTLMKILSGVHTEHAGEIYVDGRVVRFASVRDAEDAGIAIIHQELNLVPGLSGAENIFLGREPLVGQLFVDHRRMRRHARQLLGRLGLDIDPARLVGGLRIAEKQLVEIAKALSLNARLLIMDEPTSALSTAECRRLFEVIRQLARAGVAIVYISHRMDEVTALADRVSVLRDGRLIRSAPIAAISVDQIIASMVGRDIVAMTHADLRRDSHVVLAVENLSLTLPASAGHRLALAEVSFELHRGEVLGIGGLLGSGRTEILESLFGAARGTVAGTLRLDGEPAVIRDPAEAKRRGLAFVTEDRKATGLVLGTSIRGNVALPSQSWLARFGLCRPEAERELAASTVARLGVRARGIDQDVRQLSGGNQQKVVIGKWLGTGPRVLLLDEPTRGIDVGAKAEIYELIRRLAAEGIAVIVVSSELPELLLLSDRILVMRSGRPAGMLERAEATEERILRLAAPQAAAPIPAPDPSTGGSHARP